MVRVISQQTFNDVVKENMEEFDMSMVEAIHDAVQQFEAQGVDLSNIVKTIELGQVSDPVVQCIKKLKQNDDIEQVIVNLNVLQEECNKELAKKLLAAKEGAYEILLDLLNNTDNTELQVQVYQTLISLMTGYPDLLDVKGVSNMTSVLSKSRDVDIIKCVLRWCRECCIKHERNRQLIFESYIKNNFKRLLEMAMVKETCALVRSLCLDDDIRVQISKAHEHARSLAIDLLCPLSEILADFEDSTDMMTEVLLTMSTLMVRNEFCVKVYETGVLDRIANILQKSGDDEKVVRTCLILLKTLAGNDDVKLYIVQNGTLITQVMHSIVKHEGKPPCAAAGLGLIASLALRSSVNSQSLCDLNAPEVIINAMKVHTSDLSVQQRGCWAVRNIVSRRKDLTDDFLKLGIEEILINIMKHNEKCFDDAKAALRDLGCSVKLNEQWTGKGVKLKN